jgi:hypothetical protein
MFFLPNGSSKIVYQHHRSGKELTVTDGSDWRAAEDSHNREQ